jgi:hypothetical protein
VADIPVHLEAVDFHTVNATRIAKLVKCPRTLHLLWAEYILGFTGHKPASEFRLRGGQIDIIITEGMCSG